MDGTPLAAPLESDSAPVDGRDRVGEVLDRRYRLDAVVGEGGMAHVYRVTHTLIGKSLAAKVVRPELRQDAEVVRRFLREAQIVSSIKHPNVVDISDFGEMVEGGAFCVMELLRGRTLAEQIDDDGALAPEAALGVALQICQGLQASHDAGVVHRDLKPQNVFLCEPKGDKEGVVKLIDFGVARAGQRITVAGAVLGTPEYMSPEQVQGKDVDAGADLYALGVMLFEMLTAMVPFRCDDVAQTMHCHLVAEPPTMVSVKPDLAHLGRTQAVVSSLMAKSRADRPGTAADVAQMLKDAIGADLGEETAAHVVRSTLAIGSGGIATSKNTQPADAGWKDRQMPWSPGSGPVDAPPPVPAIQHTHDPLPPPRKPLPLVLVVSATALLAAGLTIGSYAAMGGFAPPPRPASTPRTVEIVSAPVPPATDDPPPVGGAIPSAPSPTHTVDPPTTPRSAPPAADPPGGPVAEPRPEPGSEPASSAVGPDKPKRSLARTKPKGSSKGKGSRGGDRSTRSTAKPTAAAPSDRPQDAPPAATESKPPDSAEPKRPPPAGDLKDPFGRK